MDNLILTISGYENEKANVKLNMDLLKTLPSEYTYFVYTNYKMPEAYKNIEFEYFNEMFYKLRNVIRSFDYLILLDGDDNFASNKISAIHKVIKAYHPDYIHNDAYYDNPRYKYNGINNNNSCITIKTSAINFDLFLNTKSLSDFLLWLPIETHFMPLHEKLTYIHNKKATYPEYKEYMLKRYMLRYSDLSLLIKQIETETPNHINWLMLRRLKKEYAKYSYILNENKRYIPDAFTWLNRNKGTDFFVSREYKMRF